MADETNILESTSYRVTKDGAEYVERWRLENVTGATPYAKYVNANSRLPDYGDVVATGEGLTLKDKKIDPISLDSFWATLTYRDFSNDSGSSRPPDQVGDDPQIEVFGAVESVRTNVDSAGELISLSPPSAFSGEDPQTPEVQIDKPVYGIRYIRRVTSAGRLDPATYVGKVNSDSFAGHSAKTWLCRSIRQNSDDGGTTFIESIELAYDPDLWTAKLFWEGEDGRLYGYGTGDDEPTEVDVYPEVAFSGLGL